MRRAFFALYPPPVRIALATSLAALLVLPGIAQAKPLRVSPAEQTITLGQKASFTVKTPKRCRLISGIAKSAVRVKKGKKSSKITVSPKKAGRLVIRLRCGSGKAKAIVNVSEQAKAPDNGGGEDNGLEPGLPKPGSPANEPRSTSRLGTNAGGVNYWDGVVPFSDLMMQSGDWLDSFAARPDGYPASLSPGERARLAIAELSYPAGAYRVSWKGEGRFTINSASFAGSGGSGQVSLDGSSLALLTITETNPANPLREIKVIAPGESGFFRERYIAQLSPYGIIRFMDWQKTNGTFSDPAPSLSCSSRTLDSSYSQGTRRGASVEVMVALANRTGAQPWFTIPHKADDSFVRCVSGVVRNNLREDLVPRFEFSNETWNPTFEQYSDLEAAGSSLGAGDAYLGLQRAHARRHNQVMDLIGQAMQGRRFIRVMAGQAANSWVLEQRLDFEGAAAGSDEVAIAPYVGLHDAFDPTEASRIAGLSQAELFAELDGKLTGEVSPWIGSHVSLSSAYNKPLIAYEGGQHLAGDQSNNSLTELFIAANRSERMGRLYDDYFALWDRLTNNAPFVHFTDSGPYSRFGSWGALESPDQDFAASPKYQALLRQAAK